MYVYPIKRAVKGTFYRCYKKVHFNTRKTFSWQLSMKLSCKETGVDLFNTWKIMDDDVKKTADKKIHTKEATYRAKRLF